MARRVAAQFGTDLPRQVVKTTITQSQAQAALQNMGNYLEDVTKTVLGIPP
jgi:hypothetical protein